MSKRNRNSAATPNDPAAPQGQQQPGDTHGRTVLEGPDASGVGAGVGGGDAAARAEQERQARILEQNQERDRRTQAANPGATVPQDESGHPAPRTAADVDAAANPHNRQEIPTTLPGHYRNGKLTLEGMRAVHARGGSVLHNGQVIRPGEKLPSEADLAKGDQVAEQQARENLLRQRRELDAQIASLGGGK